MNHVDDKAVPWSKINAAFSRNAISQGKDESEEEGDESAYHVGGEGDGLG